MDKNALLIGNSDGIGLSLTRRLLDGGWHVVGLSKSASPISDPAYEHTIVDVQDEGYAELLDEMLDSNSPLDLCVFLVGIGELLDVEAMSQEVDIVSVNFLGLVKTASVVVPFMVKQDSGHFIGLSSLADEMLSPEAPSYNASKAGFTCYLESLGLALKPKGIRVSNVRFGFVDTKMAKGDFRPFMMSAERAVDHLMACIRRKPIRYTAPWVMIPFIKIRRWVLQASVACG